jgi:hypothetical protein
MTKNGFKILKDNFGYSTLRPAQEPVIESILNKQNTLAFIFLILFYPKKMPIVNDWLVGI